MQNHEQCILMSSPLSETVSNSLQVLPCTVPALNRKLSKTRVCKSIRPDPTPPRCFLLRSKTPRARTTFHTIPLKPRLTGPNMDVRSRIRVATHSFRNSCVEIFPFRQSRSLWVPSHTRTFPSGNNPAFLRHPFHLF